jgi:hypothetical protein
MGISLCHYRVGTWLWSIFSPGQIRGRSGRCMAELESHVLRKEPADGWRVYENLRPAPRSSAPARWHQRRHKLVSGKGNPQTTPKKEDGD